MQVTEFVDPRCAVVNPVPLECALGREHSIILIGARRRVPRVPPVVCACAACLARADRTTPSGFNPRAVFACGSSVYGQAGVGPPLGATSLLPEGADAEGRIVRPQALGAFRYVQVERVGAGSRHSFAISQRGELFTWGYKCGRRARARARAHVHTDMHFSIAAPRARVTRGALPAGRSKYGECGHGDARVRLEPWPVLALQKWRVTDAAAGAVHMLCVAKQRVAPVPKLFENDRGAAAPSAIGGRSGPDQTLHSRITVTVRGMRRPDAADAQVWKGRNAEAADAKARSKGLVRAGDLDRSVLRDVLAGRARDAKPPPPRPPKRKHDETLWPTRPPPHKPRRPPAALPTHPGYEFVPPYGWRVRSPFVAYFVAPAPFLDAAAARHRVRRRRPGVQAPPNALPAAVVSFVGGHCRPAYSRACTDSRVYPPRAPVSVTPLADETDVAPAARWAAAARAACRALERRFRPREWPPGGTAVPPPPPRYSLDVGDTDTAAAPVSNLTATPHPARGGGGAARGRGGGSAAATPLRKGPGGAQPPPPRAGPGGDGVVAEGDAASRRTASAPLAPLLVLRAGAFADVVPAWRREFLEAARPLRFVGRGTPPADATVYAVLRTLDVEVAPVSGRLLRASWRAEPWAPAPGAWTEAEHAAYGGFPAPAAPPAAEVLLPPYPRLPAARVIDWRARPAPEPDGDLSDGDGCAPAERAVTNARAAGAQAARRDGPAPRLARSPREVDTALWRWLGGVLVVNAAAAAMAAAAVSAAVAASPQRAAPAPGAAAAPAAAAAVAATPKARAAHAPAPATASPVRGGGGHDSDSDGADAGLAGVAEYEEDDDDAGVPKRRGGARDAAAAKARQGTAAASGKKGRRGKEQRAKGESAASPASGAGRGAGAATVATAGEKARHHRRGPKPAPEFFPRATRLEQPVPDIRWWRALGGRQPSIADPRWFADFGYRGAGWAARFGADPRLGRIELRPLDAEDAATAAAAAGAGAGVTLSDRGAPLAWLVDVSVWVALGGLLVPALKPSVALISVRARGVCATLRCCLCVLGVGHSQAVCLTSVLVAGKAPRAVGRRGEGGQGKGAARVCAEGRRECEARKNETAAAPR